MTKRVIKMMIVMTKTKMTIDTMDTKEDDNNDTVAGQTLVPGMSLYNFPKRQKRSLKLLGTRSP